MLLDILYTLTYNYISILALIFSIQVNWQPCTYQHGEISMQPGIEPAKAVKLFLSYSHEDERQKKQLLKHLKSLERQGIIETWDDQQLKAGDNREEILRHFDEADIIACLLSADFFNSEYCYTVEMKRAWQRRKSEGTIIIPILLKPVYLDGTPFHTLIPLPKNGKSITEWNSRKEQAYREIAHEIYRVVEALKKQKT